MVAFLSTWLSVVPQPGSVLLVGTQEQSLAGSTLDRRPSWDSGWVCVGEQSCPRHMSDDTMSLGAMEDRDLVPMGLCLASPAFFDTRLGQTQDPAQGHQALAHFVSCWVPAWLPLLLLSKEGPRAGLPEVLSLASRTV